MAGRLICYKWNCVSVANTAAVWWNSANWKWSECQLVQEIVGGIPGEEALQPWLQEQYKPYETPEERTAELPEWLEEPYDAYKQSKENREKRRRFVELIARVKGEDEFNEKRRINENAKISVKDIEMVVKKVTGIDIKILGD